MIQLAELRGTIPHNYNFICEIKRHDYRQDI